MKKTLAIFLAFFCFFAGYAAEIPVIAHEKGYYTSLARHSTRWLVQQGIPAKTFAADEMTAALADAKIAFLVGFDAPTATEMATLKSYRARGGKLVVFYSSSPALAKLMGVRVIKYKKAEYPGQWSKMVFTSREPAGIPASIRQTSTVLQSSEPLPGKGKVIAKWVDRKGKGGGEAAWIATNAGFWMSHVLLADGDEHLKARLIAAFVGSVDPSLWNAKAADAKAAAERETLRSFAMAQTPQPGEIHAVWDHTGCGLYPGDWKRTMTVLKSAKVTDLFINVAGAGFAHYPSHVLPRSRIFDDEGDQLAACLAAAEGTGIRVHAWILCFNATRATPERLKIFETRGWRLKSRDGSLTEYLDPAMPDVRDYIIRAIDEILARYRVQGIHLDFVRWYERSEKPGDAVETMSKFVAEVRRHVRRPAWLTTAVLGKYPTCIASVAQDWESWLNCNLVDYVVPMDYTEDIAKFGEFLTQHSAKKSHARRTIVGIGVTANESRLSPRQVIEQVRLVRKHGLAGVALFDLDVTLQTQILPYLIMGLW